MLFGKIPNGCQIDHINGDRSDNRPDNLRIVTHAENGRNQCLRKTNTTGKMGVQKIIRNGVVYYQARWRELDGFEKSKTFSESKYPNAFELACDYRDNMILLLNQQGAGYHELHGVK